MYNQSGPVASAHLGNFLY